LHGSEADVSTVERTTPGLRDSWRVCLLDADPDLCPSLSALSFLEARRFTSADSKMLRPGQPIPWLGNAERSDGGLGVFILSGLVYQKLRLAGCSSLELLGRGDVLTTVDDGEDLVVPMELMYRAVEPSQVALLDGEFVSRAAQWPALLAALTTRAAQRTHSLALRLAIAQFAKLSDRLLLLLWHFADRWGTVAHGQVFLPLPLSHAMLAALVCARRPSVTVSLRQLAEQGVVVRSSRGFVLRGNPPARLTDLLATGQRGR
jgi:CRP/FNR family cyclic AMP-dependent transcriptional regulator